MGLVCSFKTLATTDKTTDITQNTNIWVMLIVVLYAMLSGSFYYHGMARPLVVAEGKKASRYGEG
jgi:hypothetical protein